MLMMDFNLFPSPERRPNPTSKAMGRMKLPNAKWTLNCLDTLDKHMPNDPPFPPNLAFLAQSATTSASKGDASLPRRSQ